MVFLDVGLLALLAGKLFGGSFTRLADTPLRGKWLAFAAIGLQLIAFPSELLPWSTPTLLARALWLFSYALLVCMLLLNARLTGVPLVAAGLCSNLVAVLANKGLMPVLGSALRAAGRTYNVHNNSIDLSRPHLALLVDRWAAPHWLPLANVYSVGDILIAIGTLTAIIGAMRPSRAREHGAIRAIEAPSALPPAPLR